ncbi:hypothetical protein BV98_003814 [Sphingobium herbicidovorans NBRC 16415]|uniref:Uncharacterized protein n=1 Tax=Sphingobium herbicidovorans (strain ATCC 700291 / DSM 11019 / CCUG 56400 / KCTC 2939 / LMG 18315 / NBRC 16415 / MH) TaxID=1219045 RepID=A0A086P4U6_SPHHM|nr:hypothetical protein [Sphingobium herbicidovorans]KFG88414.1 hypothetical protein BV98_003814 [Sphingobium herbicidovorans NBRC 16415]
MRAPPDQKQPRFEFEPDPKLEAFIEARVAAKAEAQAFQWRFRLVTIETMMLGFLVVAAGIALQKPPFLILRAAVMVAAGCFAGGILIIGMTGIADRSAKWLRSWWNRR